MGRSQSTSYMCKCVRKVHKSQCFCVLDPLKNMRSVAVSDWPQNSPCAWYNPTAVCYMRSHHSNEHLPLLALLALLGSLG